MNRGDRREPIFLDDAGRLRFVETLAEACAKTRLAGACLHPHAESFSFGDRDAPVESGRRDEMVAGHRYGKYFSRLARSRALADTDCAFGEGNSTQRDRLRQARLRQADGGGDIIIGREAGVPTRCQRGVPMGQRGPGGLADPAERQQRFVADGPAIVCRA